MPISFDLHTSAEITSLSLTIPLVYLAWVVVKEYSTVIWKTMGELPSTAYEWLVLGVVLGFLSVITDNTYWALPWTADLLDHPWAETLFKNGVFSNIHFRQGLGLLSTICHLQAVDIGMPPHKKKLKRRLRVALLLGLATFLILCNLIPS